MSLARMLIYSQDYWKTDYDTVIDGKMLDAATNISKKKDKSQEESKMEHDEAVRIARTILEYNGLKVSSLDATVSSADHQVQPAYGHTPAILRIPTKVGFSSRQPRRQSSVLHAVFCQEPAVIIHLCLNVGVFFPLQIRPFSLVSLTARCTTPRKAVLICFVSLSRLSCSTDIVAWTS